MNSRTLQRTRSIACVGLLTLCAAVAPHAQAHAHGKHYDLTGTWRTTVTTYDCSTGVENPSFSGYLTFSSDGTTAEATASPAFQPGQRSAGHGYWESGSRNTFRMVVEAFVLFTTTAPPPAPQFQRGRQRLDAVLKMTGRDKFESVSSGVKFFNTAGVQVGGGCARSVGERLW
ncbi:hypothetical protein [Povalibacter sp.]|uniref:hypothetical protein n=1 Tax=Povalibacter sp. TaxID=1962978 RepID=UPI002F427652